MPLLSKEPDIFPSDLLASESGEPWWVAHVRSRQEKLLARHLMKRGIGYFLPQSKREIVTGGRRRQSHVPLFSGYVFFRADRNKLGEVWRSNTLANLIEVEDQKQLHQELVQISSLLFSGASLRIYQDLLPGDPVKIHEGPFKGYQGVIVRAKSTERLIVMVSLIGKALAVEFGREVLSGDLESESRRRSRR